MERERLSVFALCFLLIALFVSKGWAQTSLDTEAETKLVKQVIDQASKAGNLGH